MSRAAYLILENGTVFEGKAFGAEKETTGELVFTTAMTHSPTPAITVRWLFRHSL